MWMMVLFDLPVVTPEERKLASDFRHFLLDEGFEMAQFSVYLRFVGERDRVPKFERRIKRAMPPHGKVSILFFTDRQFEETKSFVNRKVLPNPEIPQQLILF